MSHPQYANYKESGVQWLGKVPSHWSVEPFKRQIDRNDGGVWGEDPDGIDDTVVLRSTEQTANGQWKIEDPATRKLSQSDINGSLLVAGDLLLTKSSGSSLHIGKTTHVTEEIAAMRCCYSNFMQRIRTKSTFLSSLAWHVLNSDLARLQFDLLSNSTTGLANLNSTMIGQMILPVPPIEEQLAISIFLDRETAKIDELSKAFEGLIETLKEKRQAVISHAVTKGLDPSVPMKDSGIEWLGKVPAHWDVCSLKRFCDVRDGTHDTPQFVDQSELSFPFITSKDLGNGKVCFDDTKHISEKDHRDFSRRSGVSRNDVLMPVIGSIGGAALVDSDVEFSIKNIALFKASKNHNSHWLQFILDSDLSMLQLDLNRSGGVQGFVGHSTSTPN